MSKKNNDFLKEFGLSVKELNTSSITLSLVR